MTEYDYNDEMLIQNGQDFEIIRNGQPVQMVKGLMGQLEGRDSIRLPSTCTIYSGDVLHCLETHCMYSNLDIRPITRHSRVYGYFVFYTNEPAKTETITYNINSIQGSAIVGSQQNATINLGVSLQDLRSLVKDKSDDDQKELNKLINRLEIVTEDNQPITKGFFARFSDLLAKHSDVAIAVGQFLTSWLFKA